MVFLFWLRHFFSSNNEKKIIIGVKFLIIGYAKGNSLSQVTSYFLHYFLIFESIYIELHFHEQEN